MDKHPAAANTKKNKKTYTCDHCKTANQLCKTFGVYTVILTHIYIYLCPFIFYLVMQLWTCNPIDFHAEVELRLCHTQVEALQSEVSFELAITVLAVF